MVRLQQFNGAVILLVLFSCAWVALAPAQREMVDRVAAMVDGEAILLSDVVQEMNLVRLQRNLRELSPEQQQELFDEILNSMIDDQLLVAQAKEKGFEVGEEELQQAVDDQITEIKSRIGNEEDYQKELQKQGFTEAEVRDMHRERLQKQILVSRLVQQELRSKLRITDDQIKSFYENHSDSIPASLLQTPVKLRLAHIHVLPEVDQDAPRRKMEAAHERVTSGEDFASVASEVSEWPTATRGGDLGTFRYGDFQSNRFDEVVSKLEPGEISDIFETKFGLMIVKLESRKGSQMRARHIVVKLNADEDSQVRAFERAEVIKRRLDGGEDFGELASLYSDDPSSASKGGVLEDEWVLDDLLPQFKAAVENLAPGEISDVVQGSQGFHIFKVVDRVEMKTLSYEELAPQLRRYVEQRELDKRFREYVKELRQSFYVDIKS